MNNEKTELDWREFDKAIEVFNREWEAADRVWRDYRRLLKEQLASTKTEKGGK